MPSNPEGNGAIKITSSLSGLVWTAVLPHIRTCAPAHITITPPLPLDRIADPNAGLVSLYAHVYTAADGSGKPCVAPVSGTTCKRLTRRLPLVFAGDAGTLVGTLVPDPSASHYSFELRVLKECGVSKVIVAGELGTDADVCEPEYVYGHETPNIMRMGGRACSPLLHLYVTLRARVCARVCMFMRVYVCAL